MNEITEQIKADVLKKLNNPTNILKVDIKPISEHSFRVNVWTKTGEGLITGGKITHSEIVELATQP